jgi:hypothetical protein
MDGAKSPPPTIPGGRTVALPGKIHPMNNIPKNNVCGWKLDLRGRLENGQCHLTNGHFLRYNENP